MTYRVFHWTPANKLIESTNILPSIFDRKNPSGRYHPCLRIVLALRAR